MPSAALQRTPAGRVLADVEVTHRAEFADITGVLPGGHELPLCRSRCGGYASTWAFSIYQASHHDNQPSRLLNGASAGTPEDALDTACGLYPSDPTARHFAAGRPCWSRHESAPPL